MSPQETLSKESPDPINVLISIMKPGGGRYCTDGRAFYMLFRGTFYPSPTAYHLQSATYHVFNTAYRLR